MRPKLSIAVLIIFSPSSTESVKGENIFKLTDYEIFIVNLFKWKISI